MCENSDWLRSDFFPNTKRSKMGTLKCSINTHWTCTLKFTAYGHFHPVSLIVPTPLHSEGEKRRQFENLSSVDNGDTLDWMCFIVKLSALNILLNKAYTSILFSHNVSDNWNLKASGILKIKCHYAIRLYIYFIKWFSGIRIERCLSSFQNWNMDQNLQLDNFYCKSIESIMYHKSKFANTPI